MAPTLRTSLCTTSGLGGSALDGNLSYVEKLEAVERKLQRPLLPRAPR
jgi:hypothetical protein